ncbi:MAG TPA: carboxypeptidase-like regulatory domain-containing protein [Candidatus Sulfotelmatobacter sp.]|nr:carboxypeptidase-like regulatory domain-containing protein [Candidatus Sulfotelmatobacter sp.]
MRRTAQAVRVVSFAACFLLFSALAHAQYRASIRGVVSDPQGAVVPDVTVTLLNTDTNLAMTTKSDQNGIYTFNALPSAHYRLTAERAGFKTQVLAHVQIIPDQPNELNLQLEVGQAQESVTVSGTTETVDAETATVSGTIRTSEIQNAPAIGRNVFMLLQLAPGITGDNSQGANGGGNNLPGSAGPGNPGLSPGVNSGIFATENGPQINAGGLGYQHNGISLDGISTASAVWGGTSVITPSEDAVAEVKVISNAYDAENGRFAGAQVQVTSKSGTNQVHGALFFLAHRPGLDAHPSWAGTGQPVKNFRDNNFFDQFGGNVGGPIWKNKIFGFFNWETIRTPPSQAIPGTAWLETSDFQKLAASGSIASTYLNFPGSIPSNPTINDVSCADAGFNANGNTNCIMVPGKGLNIGSPLTTGLGTQDLGWVNAQNPGVGGGLNANGPADIAQYNTINKATYSQNQYIGRVDANLTQKDRLSGSIYWVPQSSTQSNVRAYDLFHHNQVNDAFSLIWNRVISTTFVNEARANAAGWRWNELADNPQSPLGLPASNIDGLPLSLTQFGPNVGSHLDQWTYTFKDVATKVLGRHTIKFGGEVTRLYYLQACEGCALPSYGFYNIWDFLNDAPHSESANVDPASGTPTAQRQDERENIWGLFVQDDYKLRSNLTVNLGLRWSYFGPLYSTENNMYRAVPGPGAAFLTGLSVVKANSWGAQKNNFSPDIGVAWSPNQAAGKLVFRGGFGINYNQEEIAISSNISVNPGLTVGQSLSSAGPASINPSILYATSSDLHTLNYPSNPAFRTTFGSNGLPTSGSAQIHIFPQNMPTMRAEHWSADAQYEFLPNWTASLGYQGGHSSNIIANAQIGPYAAANGYSLNNPSVQYNGWTNYWNASGYGNYNALIAEVKTNSWRGLLLDTQFTWARNWDTNTGPYTEQIYPYSGSLNYAPSDNNIARAWKFYGSYTPKFFTGRSAWMERTLGGWTLSGILNVHTGFPWTPQLGLPGGYSLYCGGCWYNNIYPLSMSGAGGSTSNSAYETGSNFGGQTGNHQSYFTMPTVTAYTGSAYGNANPPAGMRRNWITGPGYKSLDASLVKAFGFGRVPGLGEGARLEFRVDAYNLFNNLNLTGGNSGIDRNILDNNFGRSNGSLAARVVTLGARFQF